jgi:pimeloyl-ACP methyl ester carboxylesterase
MKHVISKITLCIAMTTLLLGVSIVTLVTAQTDTTGETMNVTSKDGTTIAFDKLAEGQPVILVTGALVARSDLRPYADLLAEQFTVYNYDRRGRGESSDTQPYAVEREIEDIEALIDVAGGSAFVVGFSSGAVLALEAASKLPTKVTKLVLFEPPFVLDDSRPPLPDDYVAQLNAAIAAGKPGDAVELFSTQALGIPAEYLEPMKSDPSWAASEALAHTLVYDGMVMGNTMSGKPFESATVTRWQAATMPTLVITGSNSMPFFHNGAQTLAGTLPEAQHQLLENQDHNVAPEAVVPVLIEFLSTQ